MIPYFQFLSFSIGPVIIHAWGLFIALGMVLSLWIINNQAHYTRIDRKKIIDLAFWMIVFGIIGARLFHVFFYEWDFFVAAPAEILKIWNGGMSSFGGLFGALVAVWVFKKKAGLHKENMLAAGDLLAFASLFGWMFGRLGCVMIHDHLGILSNFFLAINWPGGARLDMAILEIIALIPLAFIFARKWHTGKPDGWFVAVLFVYYGALRLVLDFFRATDIAYADARYSGLTPAQYFGILLVVVGLLILKKIRRKKA